MTVNELIAGASAELKQVISAPMDEDARRAAARLRDFFVPALEAEDPAYGRVTRALMRWAQARRVDRRQTRRARVAARSPTPLAVV